MFQWSREPTAFSEPTLGSSDGVSFFILRRSSKLPSFVPCSDCLEDLLLKKTSEVGDRWGFSADRPSAGFDSICQLIGTTNEAPVFVVGDRTHERSTTPISQKVNDYGLRLRINRDRRSGPGSGSGSSRGEWRPRQPRECGTRLDAFGVSVAD